VKNFIFTRLEGRSSRISSGTPYTVCIYQIIKGSPVHVVTSKDSFCSEFQQVLNALESVKALPKKAFQKGPFGGHRYGAAYLLREAGIANINRI
jgi:hypothetical protein